MSKQISISAILNDLENGVTRAEIGANYEISPREVKVLFDHPKLKGKKAKKVFTPSFDIVDDVPDTLGSPEEKTAGQVVEDKSQLSFQ